MVAITDCRGRPSPAEDKGFLKDSAATKAIAADFGDATLWLNEAKWHELSREPGVVRFQHSNNHVLGWFLSDKTGGISTAAMKDLALRNSRRVDPNARITLSDHRVVNGREVLYLEIILTQNSIPIRFAGYYHGGVKSNLQAVAYTVAAEFEGFQKEVNEFLNGLEVREDSAPVK